MPLTNDELFNRARYMANRIANSDALYGYHFDADDPYKGRLKEKRFNVIRNAPQHPNPVGARLDPIMHLHSETPADQLSLLWSLVSCMLYFKKVLGLNLEKADLHIAVEDENDIQDDFVNSKCCAILGLYHANGDRFLGIEGVDNVRSMHDLLRLTHRWKDYSDDVVWPEIYAFMGFAKSDKNYANKTMQEAIELSEFQRGMLVAVGANQDEAGHVRGFRKEGGHFIVRCNDDGTHRVANHPHKSQKTTKVVWGKE